MQAQGCSSFAGKDDRGRQVRSSGPWAGGALAPVRTDPLFVDGAQVADPTCAARLPSAVANAMGLGRCGASLCVALADVLLRPAGGAGMALQALAVRLI